MRNLLKISFIILWAVIPLLAQQNLPIYKDASKSVKERVNDLLNRMTVLEKARQLDMYAGGKVISNNQFDPAKAEKVIGFDGIGSLHDFYPVKSELTNQVQKYMVEKTRLGIPMLLIEEALHGYQGSKGTCFPAPIGMGSMWDVDLMQKAGRVIGTEARAHGVHFVLSPVLGLAREPRWGRVEETYGEDPYLAAQTGLAMVQGMQGKSFKDNNSVISEPKHYAIHSAPESGINTASVRVGEREARETFLYPFETAVRKGNAHGMMAAYHEWDGIPVAAHPFLLNELLRGEWGFEGMVLSDLGAIGRLLNNHRTAETPQEAITDAIKAGLDMQFYDFSHEVFQNSIVNAIADGSLTMDQLDRAAACVLRVKFKLGLFENPYTDTSLISKVHHTKENQDLALEAGRKSIVLLKNENNLLPFSKDVKSVAVVGNLASLPALGGYSPRNVEAVTILDGIKAKFGDDVEVNFEAGIEVMDMMDFVNAKYLRTPDGKHSGLLAEYFINPECEGKPDFSQIETDMSPYYHNNSPGGGIAADDFSVRWSGTITAPISGMYEIGLVTDDKGRIFINDKLIIDNWDPYKVNELITTNIYLKQGAANTIRMEYADVKDYAGLHFKWRMLKANPDDILKQKEKIKDVVKNSDISILVVGESGESVGEGKDKSNLDLSDVQLDLAKTVYSTGKPVATVLLNGRPMSVNWLAENATALVEAWFPGEKGGTAVADVLFGDVNPSGKLNVSFPKSVGQLPVFYNFKDPNRNGYVDGDSEPLFPFGYGLSYTTFEYSSLKVEPAVIPADGRAVVSVDIKNTGKREGIEVVQLYINDKYSSVTTPKIELKGFKRAVLKPGETKTVSMELTSEHLSLWNAEMQEVVEPGLFEIMAGASCRDIRLRGELYVK